MAEWFSQPDTALGTAIVLPGRMFGAGTPLLHWTSMALTQHGWSVLTASWDEQALDRGPADHVVAVAASALERASTSTPVLVVAVSLCTLALPWAVATRLPGVWLTPLLGDASVHAAVTDVQWPTMLVGGTADPYWVRQEIVGAGVSIVELAGADHGPQRRDDWRGSVLDQVPVVEAIAEFADGILADR
jgi:hypothetical protein